MASAIIEACKGLNQELVLMTLTALKGYSEEYQNSTIKKVKEGQDFDLRVPLSSYLTKTSEKGITRVLDYDGCLLGLSQEAGSSGLQLQTESSSSVEEYKDNEARKQDARRASLPAKNVSSGESKDSIKGAGRAQLSEVKGQSVRESKDSKSKPKVSNGLWKFSGTKKLQSGTSIPPKESKDKVAKVKASGLAHDPKMRLSQEGVAKGPLDSGNRTSGSKRSSYSEALKKVNGIKKVSQVTATKPALTVLRKKVLANVKTSSQVITSRTPSKRKLSIGSPEPIREDKDNEGLPQAKKKKVPTATLR